MGNVSVKSYKRRSTKGKVYTVRAYSRGGGKKPNMGNMEISRGAEKVSDAEIQKYYDKQQEEMKEFVQRLQGVAKEYGVKGGTETLLQTPAARKNPIAAAKQSARIETDRIMKEVNPTLHTEAPARRAPRGGLLSRLKSMYTEELAKASKKYGTYDEFFGARKSLKKKRK